jgi:long-subunit fatty acid transport protein
MSSFRRRTVARFVSISFVLVATCVQASGFYFGDTGTRAMLQGGAFAGQADDVTAIQHNPSGLAQLEGFHFVADGHFMNFQVDYLRQDPGFDPLTPSTKLVNPVGNRGGIFIVPFAGVSYGFRIAGRTLTLGAGVYGPPAVGRLRFEEPDYSKTGDDYTKSPKRFAPQRYNLINYDILIVYPSLSAAYEIHPHVLVGGTLQVVFSHFMFRQSLFSGDVFDINPTRQLEEEPDFDTVAKVDVEGRPVITGILGVLARPTDWISIGASARMPYPIRASGQLGIQLSDFLSSTGARVEGDKATLSFDMPLELRVGVRVRPVPRLGINADFVYQGWNSVDALTVTPDGVDLITSTGRFPLAPMKLQKNWRPAFSGRVGADLRPIDWLSIHAGAMYETSTASDDYFSIDFPHASRVFLTGGLTGHIGPLDVLAGIAWTPLATVNSVQSEVRRIQTNSALTPGVMGAGVYTTGGWSMSVGLRGHFTAAGVSPRSP